MAGITRYEAERRIKQVFEEYVGALKTAAYKKEYLKAEALSLFSGLETFETFTKTKELTELYSALNTEGIRELFRISMALAYLYRLPSHKKYKDSVIEYQKLYKIKADSREYIGEERNMEVEQGRTIRFRLEQVNDYLRAGGSEVYYTVEWKKKDKRRNDKSGAINNWVKNTFDDNPYDRDFKFNESGTYIIEADVVERLCMRQEYRKVVEHNELEVIVVPGDERIREMPFSEKLKLALEYADWEGAAYRAGEMAVMLAACLAVLGVIALTPLDEVVIVLAPILELIGYGSSAIEFAKAVYKLGDFVDRVRNAQSEGALEEAGSIFAEAAAAIGIAMLFAFLGRLSKLTKERFRNRKKVTQREIIDSIERGKIKLENNIQRGNYGEMKMDVYFEEQGYKRISIDKVTNLNAPIHKGLDGVYYNQNGQPSYIIGEAKYGRSKLSVLSDGTKQMSNDWISERLESAVGKDVADKIKLEMIINPDNVGRQLIIIDKN